MASLQHPTKLFISYAAQDEAHKQILEKHLSALQRQGIITSFDAGKIKAGENWKDSIQQQLAVADIILLLLSADALADDYLHDEQLQKALHRAENKEVVVIPILLRSVDYKGLGVEKYAVLPSNSKAVTSWQNQDEAYQHIASQIRKVVENLSDYKSGNLSAFEEIFSKGDKSENLTPDESTERKIIHQTAEKIYNIEKIDKADFS